MAQTRPVRIGNGCGFWGDSLDAPVRLAETGQLDYLTLEYLAELTMSILAILKQRDPNAGYATDFLSVLGRLAPQLLRQQNLKIITNAGGMNPLACAKEAQQILAKQGVSSCPIAIVSGDDLMPRLDELIGAGHTLSHLDSGEPLEKVRSRVVSANAYLGAEPIVEALSGGARVVITGRVADASLTLGPAMHHFGWQRGDLNRLASGTVAGHLIECGAQVTGGLWCHADETTRLSEVGYPIAEIEADGSFCISKPAGSGGAVNREKVAEQLLYEVADPARYYTPDVIADFTSVQLEERPNDVVRVSAARGLPAPQSYKVSIAYRDGYSAAGTLVLVGPQCQRNARHSGEILLDRLRQAGFEYEHFGIEVLGAGDVVPGVLKPTGALCEVVLRVAVRDSRKAAVERFTKEFAPLVTSGFPATTGYTTGRPSVREVFAYWPALIDKSVLKPRVDWLS